MSTTTILPTSVIPAVSAPPAAPFSGPQQRAPLSGVQSPFSGPQPAAKNRMAAKNQTPWALSRHLRSFNRPPTTARKVRMIMDMCAE